MNSQPLISIIVPCFNDGKYIQECLNSVYQQEYENYEVIVVDDGSTDQNTLSLLDKISHPKVRVHKTQNQGVSAARNFAISKSKGKYIFPLDADDKIGKHFIKEAIEVLEKEAEVKIVHADVEYFGLKKGKMPTTNSSVEQLLCENTIVNSSIFRRTDFDACGGYNENMKEGFEDWDFWLSLLEKGGRVHKINSLGLYYRIKKNSRNSSIDSEGFKRLRRQLYDNHKALYAKHFFDPYLSFEYQLLKKSPEYRLGKVLLKPLRFVYRFFSKFKP